MRPPPLPCCPFFDADRRQFSSSPMTALTWVLARTRKLAHVLGVLYLSPKQSRVTAFKWRRQALSGHEAAFRF